MAKAPNATWALEQQRPGLYVYRAGSESLALLEILVNDPRGGGEAASELQPLLPRRRMAKVGGVAFAEVTG